ncbi:MAG: hypothetical protein D4R74_02365 [Betaproteobacteria bacterium]|nr:MAG: hypothetical protein D4R74_02365 [Betaproteobacteria bacterium]
MARQLKFRHPGFSAHPHPTQDTGSTRKLSFILAAIRCSPALRAAFAAHLEGVPLKNAVNGNAWPKKGG